MSRYAALFARGEGVFGAFVMLGDPDIETSAAILDELVAGGADMIEVGFPFSDPVADGPVIQAAAARALAQGVRPADCWRRAGTLSTGPPARRARTASSSPTCR
jgi:tryptophan synthase alpha chain